MKKNFLSKLTLGLFLALLTWPEAAYGRWPIRPQANPENYPQIYRSSICGIRIIDASDGQEIDLLDLILQGNPIFPKDEIGDICGQQESMPFDPKIYLLSLPVNPELSIEVIPRFASISVICNAEDRPVFFNPNNLPRTIEEHCNNI